MTSEEKDVLREELKTFVALRDVAHLEGVKLLIEDSKVKVINCVEILANNYSEKSEQEIRSVCATLKANLDIYQKMTGLSEQIENIEEALK